MPLESTVEANCASPQTAWGRVDMEWPCVTVMASVVACGSQHPNFPDGENNLLN